MDNVNVPYKVEFMVETYQGDWTAEQIAEGCAGEPTVEKQSAWYENINGTTQQITDPQRIEELESSIS